jgi:hypothetical protein
VSAKLILTLCGAGLLIAGCGIREPLRPADGQTLPPPPALSRQPLTADQLLAVPTEFRPLRVDEPITRSQRRPVDPFDLPPPDVGGATEGEPSELEEQPQTAPANPPQ